MSHVEQPHQSWDMFWGDGDALWFEQPAFLSEIIGFFERARPLSAPLLDVGCGRGVWASFLVHGGLVPVFCSDFSLNSLRCCPLPAVTADCGKLPLQSDFFDSLTAILLIEHVPHWSLFLAEAHRLLRSGGGLYLVFPNLWSLVTPGLLIKRLLGKNRKIPYHRPLTAQGVTEMAKRIGFDEISVDYLSIGPYRQGHERFFSWAAEKLLPKTMREEIILVCQKKR